jgi:single-stranded-DNA-specific exonuclease
LGKAPDWLPKKLTGIGYYLQMQSLATDSMRQEFRSTWLDPEPLPAEHRQLHDHPVLAALLYRRGIRDRESARDFLDSRPRPAPDPYQMPGMGEAVDRIRSAIRRRERVAIFGDYDADGVTSVALLTRAMHSAMGDEQLVMTRLPTRREGYGLNAAAIDDMASSGATLLIAIDCASSDHEQVAYAVERGLDVVIFDHHHMADDGPPGAICVSAYRTERGPYHDLCAAGIAYLLVSALAQHGIVVGGSAGQLETALLDYVALGSIADVASLAAINRPLVRDGLATIQKRPRAGIAAVCQAGGFAPSKATSTDIAFKVAPRINSAGRMGDPRIALQLMLEDDAPRAMELASQLEVMNRQRKAETSRIVESAETMLLSRPNWDRSPVIVLASPSWSAGILGIAAAKLAERFGRPAILLYEDGEMSRGSARSIPGFDIVEALKAYHGPLVAVGGHSQAAGLTIRNEHIEALRDYLGMVIDASGLPWPADPSIRIDAELAGDELGLDLVTLIDQLQPFGAGNEQPVFKLAGLPLQRYEVMGQDRSHLRLVVRTPRGNMPAPFFGAAHRSRELVGVRTVDLAVTLNAGYWNGPRLDVHVQDMRPASDH